MSTRACRYSTTSSSIGWAPTSTSATVARTTRRTVRTGRHGTTVRGLHRRPQRGGIGPRTKTTRRCCSRRRASCRPTSSPVRKRRTAWLGHPGGTVRPTHGRLVRLQPAGRRRVQAAEHPRWISRRRHPENSTSGPRTTPRRSGTSCSSRRTRSVSDMWTTLPDANGHTTQEPVTAAWRDGWISCTRSWPTTWTRPALPPERRESGTRPRGIQRLDRVVDRPPPSYAGSAGRGLDLLRERLGDPEHRRLPRRRLGPRGGRIVSEDRVRGQTWVTGSFRACRRVRSKTPTTGSAPSWASKRAPSKPRRTPCSSGSDWRGRPPRSATDSSRERWGTCSTRSVESRS